MRFLLLNVAPLLWLLFSGQLGGQADLSHLALAPAIVAEIGRDLPKARATVPCSQARSLRNLAISFQSYKAVDWLFFLLSTAEVVLADRLSPTLFGMIMHLVGASRVLFRPRPVTLEELKALDERIKSFCRAYYAHVDGGQDDRLPLCRSTVAALLDIVPNIRSCGPIWTYWQFVMGRLVGTLPKLVGWRSNPYSSLIKSISRKYQTELITAYGATFRSDAWTEANGKVQPSKAYVETLFPSGNDSSFVLLSPRRRPSLLSGQGGTGWASTVLMIFALACLISRALGGVDGTSLWAPSTLS